MHHLRISARIRAIALALVTAAALGACGGGGGSQPSQPSPQAGATELTLSASSTSVTAGGTAVTLSANLNGAGTVNWALASGAPGTLSAANGSSVVYTPPARNSITTATTVTVNASSGSLSKSISLQLAPADPPGLKLLAGTITTGGASIDGAGSNARFNVIRALTADSSGTVYVADANSFIRKVSADGTVTSVNANWSLLNGSDINKITLAADGSLYFSAFKSVATAPHSFNYVNSFYKLGTDGSISLLGTADDHSTVWSLAAGRDGVLYAYNSWSVYTLASDGSLQLLAGSSTGPISDDVDGTGTAARFYGLIRIQVSKDGTLYALDLQGLRQITKAGVVTTLMKLGDYNYDLSLDAADHPLLLAGSGVPSYSYQIKQYGANALNTLYTVGSADSSDTQSVSLLQALADGAVITSDGTSLSRIGTDGKAVLLAGVRSDWGDRMADGTGTQARYRSPSMLAADHDGNIYSTEGGGNGMALTIRKTTPAGVATTFAASSQLGSGAYISGMAVTSSNTLVISVATSAGFGGRLYKVGQGSVFSVLAGGDYYSAPLQQKDGQGTAAVFGQPTLLGADADGNLYVSDLAEASSTKTTIRKVTAEGMVSTISSLPAGLGAAADGYVYKINEFRSGVLRVAADGTQTLVAGSNTAGNTNLPGPLPARLYMASSIVPLRDHVFAVAAGNGIYILTLP